jgi:hypothetical protein
MKIVETYIVFYKNIYVKAHKTQVLIHTSNFGTKTFDENFFIETSNLIKPITKEEFLDLTNNKSKNYGSSKSKPNNSRKRNSFISNDF